jgi:YebC/PmpR family DNA-binding regulatory protein
MAGHSHWAGIKYKKGIADAKRGKIFSKLTRNITTAARDGGGNPDMNLKLKYAIEKAKEANMPKDNIARAVKKGTGEIPGAQLERCVYEGYGPGGVAIMVEVLTDNRNRTGPEIRKIFETRGGNLGSSGCVAWKFEAKGLFSIAKDDENVDEDELMTVVIEAGADDVETVGDSYQITCGPTDFYAVKEALEGKGYTLAMAEQTRVPNSTVQLSAEDGRKILGLMEAIDEHDDVENAYADFDLPDELVTDM